MVSGMTAVGEMQSHDYLRDNAEHIYRTITTSFGQTQKTFTQTLCLIRDTNPPFVISVRLTQQLTDIKDTKNEILTAEHFATFASFNVSRNLQMI